MIRYPETPGWDLPVTLEGRCRHCGADLSGTTRVRATTEWVKRYHTEPGFKGMIDLSIARIMTARHERVCAGQRFEPRVLSSAWATSA